MSYFCRSRNTILCSKLPYAVAHTLFFTSHPRCSLVPEAVSHRGRIYTVVLGRVPRNRKHLEARGSSRDPSPKGHEYLDQKTPSDDLRCPFGGVMKKAKMPARSRLRPEKPHQSDSAHHRDGGN